MMGAIIKNKNKTIKLFNNSVYEQIRRFLRNRQRNSKHTAQNYESDINHFFQSTRGKRLKFLNKKDLVYTIEEIEDYYANLLDEQKVTKSTANRYLSSIRSLFKYLNQRGIIENISFLEIETFHDPPVKYGILTPDEVEKAMQLVLKQGKPETAIIKHMLIKFASDTSVRLSGCLALEWKDFVINGETVEVNIIGKGNKRYTTNISRELYEELQENLKGDKERVFNIHRNTVNSMMKSLREEMNIPKERNIVFHSFRKAGVDHVWKNTRDLNQARKKANHSSTQVTERYIDTEEDYGIMGMFSSRDGVDEELFKKVDKDLLLQAISEMNKATQMNINIKLDELMKKKYNKKTK